VREESRFLKNHAMFWQCAGLICCLNMAISENISLKSGNFGKKIHRQVEKVSTKKL
jgi:hypothetical protein